MITVNSTILSYNKINQVQEQIPLELPDSYIFEEKKSAQKLMPDLYDLDRLENENIFFQRNSTPILGSKNGLRNNYFYSVFKDQPLLQNFNTNKVTKKIIQPNIYSNYDDNGIESIRNSKELKNNDIEEKKEDAKNIYQNEIYKINDDIINNININKNLFITTNKKENFFHAKSGIYNQNLLIDINSTSNKINDEDNINQTNKKYEIFRERSIQSAFNAFSFKNIMKKDTNKNIITINTSLYKPRKRRTTIFSINNSLNDKNKNSLNNYLKFEEESYKEQNSLNHLNYKRELNNKFDIKKNLKEEILKSFRNSNSIFNLSNNSHLEQDKSSKSNVNDLASEANSFLNMEENYNLNNSNNDKNLFNIVPKNNPKRNSLSDYNFKKERNSTQRISQKNNNINYRFSSMSSKRYNFNFPKNIISEELSKDREDIKPKSEFRYKVKNNKEINPFIPKVKINFKNLKKILKKDSFFNILTFLDDNDLMSLLQTNKSLISLINKSITDAYFLIIKKNLKKYKSIFELLKCSLIHTKLKDSFKIDFVINIRFIDPNNINSNIKAEELTPKCYQIIFFYQCYKPIEPNAKLKTKENTKKIKMYDYYTFDLYPNGSHFPSIYITKESQQLTDKNAEEKLVYIQPILPFKFNDKGIINFEIYSSKNDFIVPSSIKVFMKQFTLKDYINELNIKQYNNLRICEYEDLSTHWKLFDEEKNNNSFREIKNNLRRRFEPNFYIENISYVNIGFFLYKIIIEAKKPGFLDRNKLGKDFGINLLIKSKYENIENEIKKNNLIIERRQIFELREGDKIIIYISAKKYKSKKKK